MLASDELSDKRQQSVATQNSNSTAEQTETCSENYLSSDPRTLQDSLQDVVILRQDNEAASRSTDSSSPSCLPVMMEDRSILPQDSITCDGLASGLDVEDTKKSAAEKRILDEGISVEDNADTTRTGLDTVPRLEKSNLTEEHTSITNTSQEELTNVLESEMKWKTDTPAGEACAGEPDDYTFYEFCNNENTTEFFKYKPRRAHVKATLYKECRNKKVSSLREITEKKENLCPTVYMRIAGGWKSSRADEDEFYRVKDINKTLSWIKPSIRTFITENADEQSREVDYLKKSLEKPTLYWAVLNDRDFMPGEKLKLKETGRTQVYVGRAINGIKGRWTRDGDNHCKMMKKCLDNVCAMTTYDPLRLEGISLVDARLTLAKVRREETALFVIKTFGDDVEKAKIAVERAEASLHKAIASSREGKASLREAEASLRAAKTILQKELDQAIVDDSKENRKTTKSEAEAPLSAAEKSHKEGKRVNSRENIIPYDDDMTWTPKDMGYGMNFS